MGVEALVLFAERLRGLDRSNMKDFTFRNPATAVMGGSSARRHDGPFSVCRALALAVLIVALGLAGCAAFPEEDGIGGVPVETAQSDAPSSEDVPGDEFNGAASAAQGESEMTMNEQAGGETADVLFPEELLTIPASYSEPCETPGHLERLDYDTYEAFSYADRTQPLSKYAIVYVPAGYDPAQSYNVVYLMHGGWSDQTTFLGTPEAPSAFKNQIDHAMADGVIKPCLIVCPTYNNTSLDDAADYSLALELTARYPQELVGDLMPAVAAAYSTYAADGTPEALAASRDHRAFMGFSMGSVTTWHIFESCLAYFRYFAPASGNAGSGAYWADAVRRQGFGAEDFLIIGATGTDDFNGSAFAAQMQDMAANPLFHEGDGEAGCNLIFRIGEGERHDGQAANRYMYNALAFLWRGGAATE